MEPPSTQRFTNAKSRASNKVELASLDGGVKNRVLLVKEKHGCALFVKKL